MNKFFNFFNIEILSFEESYSFFFIGPAHHTPESFKVICDKHLPAATLLAVAAFNNASVEDYMSISMVNIIANLETLLEVEGFSKIEPKTTYYSGSSGRIDEEEAKQLGVGADTALLHSGQAMQEYEFDEVSGDRRSY